MQLNKYIALSGVTSRRKANILIKEGKITVNGTTVKEMGVTVKPGTDKIELNNEVLQIPSQYRYILFNKPAKVITSFSDQRKRTLVIDCIDIKERIYPVGRLDYDTTGVLLLTNDGDLTYRLAHPKFEIDKIYEVLVQGYITNNDIQKLKSGVDIGNGHTVQGEAKIIDRTSEKSFIKIVIHEGKKRQIKRMMKSLNHPVIKLTRTVFAGLTVHGLQEGEWRELNPEEITILYQKTGLK